MKPGRPARKKGAAAKNAASRKAYNALPVSKRKAIVAKRDPANTRAADAKRYASQKTSRDAYHREQSKAKTKSPPKPKTCTWPGCKATNIQFHHQGIDRWLCPTHHAAARKAAR